MWTKHLLQPKLIPSTKSRSTKNGFIKRNIIVYIHTSPTHLDGSHVYFRKNTGGITCNLNACFPVYSLGWVGSAGSLHVKNYLALHMNLNQAQDTQTEKGQCSQQHARLSTVLPLIVKRLNKDIRTFYIQETLKALFWNEYVLSPTVFSIVCLRTNAEIPKPLVAPTEASLVLGSNLFLVNESLVSYVSITAIGWQAWGRLSTTTLRLACWNSRPHRHLDPLRTCRLVCGTVAQNSKGSQNSNRLHQYLWKNSNIFKYSTLTWRGVQINMCKSQLCTNERNIFFGLQTSGEARSSTVVKALCYKPEDHGFHTWWGKLIFSIFPILLVALGPGVYLASNRNEYQKQKNNITGEWSMVGV
jgi:hypothetical protein